MQTTINSKRSMILTPNLIKQKQSGKAAKTSPNKDYLLNKEVMKTDSDFSPNT